MNTTKNEQYKKTHEKLQRIITDLLEIKDIKKITVSEICQIAKINRATFYYHYLDVYDLTEKTFSETNRILLENFRKFTENVPFSRETYYRFFEFIKQNRRIYKITNSSRVSFPINEGLEQLIDLLYEQEDTENETMQKVTFFQAGFTFILRNWLDENCASPIDDLIIVLERFNLVKNNN